MGVIKAAQEVGEQAFTLKMLGALMCGKSLSRTIKSTYDKAEFKALPSDYRRAFREILIRQIKKEIRNPEWFDHSDSKAALLSVKEALHKVELRLDKTIKDGICEALTDKCGDDIKEARSHIEVADAIRATKNGLEIIGREMDDTLKSKIHDVLGSTVTNHIKQAPSIHGAWIYALFMNALKDIDKSISANLKKDIQDATAIKITKEMREKEPFPNELKNMERHADEILGMAGVSKFDRSALKLDLIFARQAGKIGREIDLIIERAKKNAQQLDERISEQFEALLSPAPR